MSDAGTRLRRLRGRPTKRALLHLVLGTLLYGAGANVAAGWVVAIAGLVLGVVPWAAVSAWRASGRVEVARTIPDRATAGIPTPVAVHVRAPTAASVVVRDALTGAVGATGDPRGSVTLTTEATLPRGSVSGGRIEVTVTDLFGLVRIEAGADVASAAEVLPAVPRVSRPPALAARRGGDDSRLGRSGHGTEVIGAREHVGGTPLRAVHWRSSARRGQLVVRDLAEPAVPTLRVVFEATTWPLPTLDRATEVAGGLAEAARNAGQPAEVAADGAVVPWGPAARRHLACLPPHAGAPPRALAATPDGGDVVVGLAPAPLSDGTDGVRVTFADGHRHHAVGVLPADAGVDLAGWLVERLAGRAYAAVAP